MQFILHDVQGELPDDASGQLIGKLLLALVELAGLKNTFNTHPHSAPTAIVTTLHVALTA